MIQRELIDIQFNRTGCRTGDGRFMQQIPKVVQRKIVHPQHQIGGVSVGGIVRGDLCMQAPLPAQQGEFFRPAEKRSTNCCGGRLSKTTLSP